MACVRQPLAHLFAGAEGAALRGANNKAPRNAAVAAADKLLFSQA